MANQIKKSRKTGTTDAGKILYNRYIKGNPAREQSLRQTIAEMSLGEYVREIRERSEMTQQQLADAIGTQRTAISRLESADYTGHSVDMLLRIAKALNGKLVVKIKTASEDRELVLAG